MDNPNQTTHQPKPSKWYSVSRIRWRLLRFFSAAKIIRYLIYVVSAIVAGTIFLITLIIGDNPFARDVNRISLTVMISAAILPLAKELVDTLLESYAKQSLTEDKNKKLIEESGIILLSNNWVNLTRPIGDGLIYRELASEFLYKCNWYIVTINPRGLMQHFFHEVLLNALKLGSTVKWAYLRMPKRNAKTSEQNQQLLNWWLTRYDATMGEASDPKKKIEITRKNLEGNVNILQTTLDLHFDRGRIHPSQFSLYENQIPTTYLGVLAIRAAEQDLSKISEDKPLNRDIPGLALIHPYQMWHASDEHLLGMILGNRGELYHQYASSMLRFFYLGEERKFLTKVWPEQQKPHGTN